ncbi:MAG: DinB family protein [Rhodovibrionaceae bacterium]|nr:DinB family protein [Rhodovibrionaceae bacterium]
MQAEQLRSFSDYNAWATARVYDAVAALPPEERAKKRQAAFFGSIVGTLNHLLVVDRIWMGRIEGKPPARIVLDEIVSEHLGDLRALQEAEVRRIAEFCQSLEEADLGRVVHYTGGGRDFADPLGRLLAHLFNHQTHHRGQIHALILEAGAKPPPLDYLYYLRAAG